MNQEQSRALSLLLASSKQLKEEEEAYPSHQVWTVASSNVSHDSLPFPNILYTLYYYQKYFSSKKKKIKGAPRMRGVAPEKSLQFSAFTHIQGAQKKKKLQNCQKFFFFLCAAPPDDPFGFYQSNGMFFSRKIKLLDIFFLSCGKRFTHIVDMQCGGSTTSSIYHTEGHAERERMKMFPPFFFFFSILWKADPSVQLSAGHDQSRSQQLRFFQFFFFFLVVAPDDLYSPKKNFLLRFCPAQGAHTN